MEKRLQIDTHVLRAQANRLNNTAEELERDFLQFQTATEGCIDRCNSDFIVELQKLLTTYRADRAAKTVRSVTNYAELLSKTEQAWTNANDALTNQVKEVSPK